MAQALLFPMNTLNITQGVLENFSHQGSYAIDVAGNDTGKDKLYAPCDMKCVYVDKQNKNNGHACVFESLEPVQLANGKIDYVTMQFIHDEDISNISVGKVFKQNEYFYDEGKYGLATGNHVHMAVARGKYTGKAWVKNGYSVWCLPNEAQPSEFFFLKSTCKIINDKGYKWKFHQVKSNWVAYPNSQWKYTKPNGQYAWKEFIWDDEYQAWYYFDENGYMARNYFVKDTKRPDKWCYLQADGKMFKGGTLTFSVNNSGYILMK